MLSVLLLLPLLTTSVIILLLLLVIIISNWVWMRNFYGILTTFFSPLTSTSRPSVHSSHFLWFPTKGQIKAGYGKVGIDLFLKQMWTCDEVEDRRAWGTCFLRRGAHKLPKGRLSRWCHSTCLLASESSRSLPPRHHRWAHHHSSFGR